MIIYLGVVLSLDKAFKELNLKKKNKGEKEGKRERGENFWILAIFISLNYVIAFQKNWKDRANKATESLMNNRHF